MLFRSSLTLNSTNNSPENQDLFAPTRRSRLRRPAHTAEVSTVGAADQPQTNSALPPRPLLPQATRPQQTQPYLPAHTSSALPHRPLLPQATRPHRADCSPAPAADCNCVPLICKRNFCKNAQASGTERPTVRSRHAQPPKQPKTYHHACKFRT